MVKNFLAKKSWHTQTLRNVERVWVKEQEHEREQKKLEEVRRKLEEERQIQELRDMQVSTSRVEAMAPKLDWMYEVGIGDTKDASGSWQPPTKTESTPSTADATATDAEKYMTQGVKADLAKGKEDVKQLKSQPGSLWLKNPANAANEAFARIREDPMSSIRKAELEQRNRILSNPVLMKKLQEQIKKEKVPKEQRKEEKRKKKEEKKKRKEEKRKRKESRAKSEGESSSSDESDVSVKKVSEFIKVL
eukprot:TRINITY_DN3407_c0_g1_i1.p2 TRINITY_DN3407_c0_g1~~TRINITY_DN3407_c0_g1_i1.p2  ORF type:complete len:248 (-),score=72.00 TRINITY_DN3407_c0_g1_i1:302-1045(-)